MPNNPDVFIDQVNLDVAVNQQNISVEVNTPVIQAITNPSSIIINTVEQYVVLTISNAIVNNNTLSFTLPSIPYFPSKSRLYVNGVKVRFPNEYVINNDQLIWNNTFILNNESFLEIYYI